jgi:hypothetical protein
MVIDWPGKFLRMPPLAGSLFFFWPLQVSESISLYFIFYQRCLLVNGENFYFYFFRKKKKEKVSVFGHQTF